MNQQRVEFFNTESSFGSQSSLASSRYFDLTNQIAQETQTVFLTLKRQLLPTQQLTNLDKIQYLNNRAKIISNDTIPDHYQYLQKITAPKQSKQICKKCSQKLKKFTKDFQSLKNGTMLHKQFYNIYGRSNEDNIFFKNERVGIVNNQQNNMLQPDVEIIQQPRTSRVRLGNQYNVSARGLVVSSVNGTAKEKQVRDLHGQIIRMKKRQIEYKRQFEEQLNNERINCQKRIRMFLSVIDEKIGSTDSHLEKLNTYKNQLTIAQNSLEISLSEKQDLITKNNQLKQTIKGFQRQNQSLKQELSGYRKLQNSRFQDLEDQMNRSVHSQFDNNPQNPKKLDLVIKKLTAERDILRNQLNKQRENLHKLTINKQQDQTKQINRIKKLLQKRNQQNQQLQRSFDKIRIDAIQLKQQNKKLKKDIQTIKQNHQELKIKTTQYQNFDNFSVISTKIENGSQKNIAFKKGKDNGSLELSAVTKINNFGDYQGEGIEGYPYFQLLSKQFKIRFKRSCLKNKQLLYKENGLQIGVISQFFIPNIVKVLIHITNSSEIDIKNLKIKAMNPNQNKVQYQVQQIKLLSSNQQVKIPISCIIKNYPIGPVVLVLDYFSQSKQDLRLLLPVHIFKCVDIQPRAEKLYKPNKINVKAQRKICKDLNILKEYLNSQNRQQIKVKIRHQHSNSSMYLDARLVKDEIEIEYEHIEGYENFTQYFIKTFKTLLQRLN